MAKCVLVIFVLRQYLVVVFRDKPLELWDIRTGTLLREMARNFPTVTALVKYKLLPREQCVSQSSLLKFCSYKQQLTRQRSKMWFKTVCTCIPCVNLSTLYFVAHTRSTVLSYSPTWFLFPFMCHFFQEFEYFALAQQRMSTFVRPEESS